MEEQLKLKEQLEEMKRANQTTSVIDKDIQALEEEIELEKQRIADLDRKIELADEIALEKDTAFPLSIREATTSLKSRIGELLHDKNGELASREDIDKLTTLFKAIQEEIQTHLNQLNSIKSAERRHQLKE